MPARISRILLTSLAASVFLTFSPALSIAQEPQHLSVADFLDFEQVADPQISPDGTQIIYTRRWVDAKADYWRSALWIMDADGSRHRFLIKGSNARWSPSGDRILFIAGGDNEKSQIFVRWMDDEGAVSQVTRVDFSPGSPEWSPDGNHIAFVGIVPADDGWDIDLPPPPEGAEWSKTPRILDRLHYRQDYVGYTDPGFSHLFVVPAESGTARQLTEGDWNVGARFDALYSGAGLSWSADGTSIYFDGLKDESADFAYKESNIYRINVSTKEISSLTSETGFWSGPEVSPDGRQIAFTGYPASNITYEMQRLYVMNSDGGNARIITPDFDRPPRGLRWDSNGSGIYFTAQDEGYMHVFHATMSGEVHTLSSGKQTLSLNSTDRAQSVGVGIKRTASEPGDVYAFPLDGIGDGQQLTAVNQDVLDGITLGAVEEIWFEAEDGNEAHGWIVKPPDFNPENDYPLLMEIHGGPFGMYSGTFNFNYQAFAANGFVVLYTNPRGSTGYGEAFSQAIDHAYPSVDYLDLMAGVDAALAEGYIDEKRLYVGGCSGGGVLSSWMIGHTNRFAAAAVRCPVSNWLSFAGTTDIPYFTYSFFDKPFWEDPSDWLQHSSLMYVGNVTTPTIVMTGEQDMRTPMPQSEEYYAALKYLGVPSKLIRFNDQYHGTGTRPSNNMRTMLYMMDWYNSYTLDGEVEDDPEE